MATPHYRLTTEQIEILSQNPNVYSVDCHKICFTAEFKETFWRMYTEENLPTTVILRENGIDPKMLGSSRVRGIAQAIKKQYFRHGSFSSIPRRGYGSQNAPASEREVRRLRTEVEYLKQERDFLKKIMSAGKGGRSI